MRRRLPPELMYPAGEQGIEVRRVDAGGVSLRVLTSGPAEGMPVVLVHGWGSSVYSFAETIPALARAGFRAIAIDLPGFGLSDKPSAERHYTTGALADAVLAVVRALGVSRFALAGHSMGGAVALDIACRGTRGLAALVLLNAVGLGRVPVMGPLKLLSPEFVDRFSHRLISRPLVRFTLAMAFGTRGRPTEGDIDEYWAPSQFREYAWACRACVHHVTWRPLREQALRALSMPVLAVIGGRDPMVLGSAERARLIPNAHVCIVEVGGHLALQECAERVNAELVAFLRARAGA